MANENETVEQLCSELRGYEGEYRLKAFGVINPEYKFLTDKILAAHKREIAELKANYELERFSVNKGIDEIAKRDALIKELADALDSRLCDYACEIHGECLAGDDMNECQSVKHRALVAKAREMVK